MDKSTKALTYFPKWIPIVGRFFFGILFSWQFVVRYQKEKGCSLFWPSSSALPSLTVGPFTPLALVARSLA